MEIGAKVRHKIEATGMVQTGTVIWMHPQRYFYRAEFESRNGNKFIEAFLYADPERVLHTPPTKKELKAMANGTESV